MDGFVKGGEEHRFRRGPARYHKATYSGHYGFTVILANGHPTLTHALPGEYLARLILANHLLSDEIRLEGITRELGELVIVTSQPTIIGKPCTFSEMTAYFTHRHFAPLPGLSLGNPGSLSFYRDLDQTAAFDVHPGNVLRDGAGVVLPIDIILVAAGDALAELLAARL